MCQPWRGQPKRTARRHLGPPMTTSTEVAGDNTFWIYLVGPERSAFRLDDETLSVELDPRGRIVAFALAAP
jgi:hypothetical protein